MRRLLAAALLVTAAVATAQTAPVGQAPVLEKRGAGDAPRAAQTHAAEGFSTLPDAASGEYELVPPRSEDGGSVVQITIEHNHLTGYVTKMEQGSALTLFFDHTTLEGSRISFTTKVVHGLRYEFAGMIVRGDAQSASETGFFRMVGELTSDRNGARETQRVSLKSTPRD
jgi:hypothetical protein